MGYWEGIPGCEGGEALAQGAQRSWGCPGKLFQARLDGAWSNLLCGRLELDGLYGLL